jgi:hypothetical protein
MAHRPIYVYCLYYMLHNLPRRVTQIPKGIRYKTGNEAMCVQRNTEARSCNYSCRGQTINITYTECVFVPLSIQCAMRMRHIVVCGLFRSTVSFHIISKKARFKKKVIEHKTCVLIFSTILTCSISHSKMKWARYDGLQVMYPIFLTDLNENWIFLIDFREQLKLHEKSVPWEPSCSMRMDRRTDMKKPTVAFRNCAKGPENG